MASRGDVSHSPEPGHTAGAASRKEDSRTRCCGEPPSSRNALPHASAVRGCGSRGSAGQWAMRRREFAGGKRRHPAAYRERQTHRGYIDYPQRTFSGALGARAGRGNDRRRSGIFSVRPSGNQHPPTTWLKPCASSSRVKRCAPVRCAPRCFTSSSGKQRRSPRRPCNHTLGLTRREQRIVPFITQGLTNKEIANHFCPSEQTVKTISTG